MRRLLAAVAFGLLLSATPALAEITPRDRVPVGGMDGQLSVWGIYSYHYSFGGHGLGARYQKTVLPQGLLNNPSIREDIGIEGGIDFVHYSWDYGLRAAPPGPTMSSPSWPARSGTSGSTPQLAVYPKLDIGLAFGSWSDNVGYGHPSSGGVLFQGAVGGVYKLDRLALRLELGSAYVRGGVAFNF